MQLVEKVLEGDLYFHRISTLLIILLGVSLALIEVIFPFYKEFDGATIHQIVILVSLWLLIIAIWWWNRAVLPKGNSRKPSLVIAITTENKKQKNKIAKDFQNQIYCQLQKYDLDKKYSIIILNNHLSSKIRDIIIRKNKAFSGNVIDYESIGKFDKMSKWLCAKFFVYGDLVLRDSPNESYYLNIEGLITHKQTTLNNQIFFSKEFQTLWEKEVKILRDEEYKGFKATGDNVFVAAAYMIGLTTFADNNFQLGIEIFEKLYHYVKENESMKEVKRKVETYRGISYLMMSKKLYLDGNIEQSSNFLRKYLNLFPNEYSTHLSEAIIQTNIKGNYELALEHVEKASKLAGNDGTWKYSKAYLLITLERYSEALKMYDQIIAKSYKNEFDTIVQVISYNQNCFDKNSNHIQSLFIIGLLTYKKLDNPVDAYDKFEQFIHLAKKEDLKYNLLIKRATQYLEEINGLLKIIA